MPGTACKSGCAFCCYIPVVCSEAEARRAYEAAPDWARIDTATGEDFTPCPFLDLKTKRCGVYEARPYPCRGYNSLSRTSCEKAHRKRIADAPIPSDYQIYSYWWSKADAIPGPKRPLVAWLKEIAHADENHATG